VGTRELREKYGRGASPNTRTLINRAIRAELVGGDHCLDALNALDQLRQQWLEWGWTEGLAEIEDALAATRRLYGRLGAEVRRRYGMPAECDHEQA
jgi:hypothetical protein